LQEAVQKMLEVSRQQRSDSGQDETMEMEDKDLDMSDIKMDDISENTTTHQN